jgi:archaellum component FlaC
VIKLIDLINEEKMTPSEKKGKEKIVKGMKKAKGDFKKRYGKDAEAVIYATATKRAMDEKKGRDLDDDGDIDSDDYLKAKDIAIKKAKSKKINEGDHEVSMAVSSLEAIAEAIVELRQKLGNQERNIPGWIQDHIAKAENYIEQAAQGFHELKGDDLNEDVKIRREPAGFRGVEKIISSKDNFFVCTSGKRAINLLIPIFLIPEILSDGSPHNILMIFTFSIKTSSWLYLIVSLALYNL